MNNNLENIVLLQKELQNISKETYGFIGSIKTATDTFIALCNKIKSHIRECYYTDNNEDVDFENVQMNRQILIKINLANISNYYHTTSEFLKANKIKLKSDIFYIREIDYFEGETTSIDEIENYKTNIDFISLLNDVSDYHKNTAGDLELFFYKAEQGATLLIEYNWEQIPKDLSKLKSKIKDLKSQLSNSPDVKERKQIFINELINILKKNNSYEFLLQNINLLIENYEKSFALYLSGFSFDKIKTASVEHFQELTDKIHSTILKYSTYIFTIPVTYLFLVRFLDFTGKNILKDTFLITLGLIFFLLIWFVLFKNINEAITSVENDIISFNDKLSNDENLSSIKAELEEQKDKILQKQKRKLLLAKILTIIILAIILIAYLFIHYDYFRDKFIMFFNKPTNHEKAYTQPYTLPSHTSQIYKQKLVNKYIFANTKTDANKIQGLNIKKELLTTTKAIPIRV